MKYLTFILFVVSFEAICAAERTSVPPASKSERALIEAAFHLDAVKVIDLVKSGVDVNVKYGDHYNESVFIDPWTLGWSPVGSNQWSALIAVASSNKYPPPPVKTRSRIATGR